MCRTWDRTWWPPAPGDEPGRPRRMAPILRTDRRSTQGLVAARPGPRPTTPLRALRPRRHRFGRTMGTAIKQREDSPHGRRRRGARAQLRDRRGGHRGSAALARPALRSAAGAAGRIAGVRARARADDAPELRPRATRQDGRGRVPRRRRRGTAQPGRIRFAAVLPQRHRWLRPAAEEIGGSHPELAWAPSAVARPHLADRRRRTAEQHRDVAQGAPRRRPDVRPGRNEDPDPGADRHGHRRAHRPAPGRPARGLPAARPGARQSRRALRRRLSPRRLRPGPDRGAERGADGVLPGSRAAAARQSTCRWSRR